jgi:hypothetical protein
MRQSYYFYLPAASCQHPIKKIRGKFPDKIKKEKTFPKPEAKNQCTDRNAYTG